MYLTRPSRSLSFMLIYVCRMPKCSDRRLSTVRGLAPKSFDTWGTLNRRSTRNLVVLEAKYISVYHADQWKVDLPHAQKKKDYGSRANHILLLDVNIAVNSMNSIEPHNYTEFQHYKKTDSCLSESKFGEAKCCKIALIHARRRFTTSAILQLSESSVNFLFAGSKCIIYH